MLISFGRRTSLVIPKFYVFNKAFLRVKLNRKYL